MADGENLTLDTLSLNDGNPFSLESIELPPPAKIVEWVRGSDGDGAVLARISMNENREVTARVRVEPQGTQDLALTKLGLIVDKLQEAERNPETGVDLVWTPAGSTKTLTLKVLSGEVTGLPITPTGDDAGWFVFAPIITVKLTCRPFLYGAEVGPVSVTFAGPVGTLEVTGVPGDVAAEGRLRIIDNAAQSRRLVRFGIESRDYPIAAPPSLELDSDSLVTAGFAGVGAVRAGAYDPGSAGNNVVRATLTGSVVNVCGTGDLTHIGAFNVFARVYSSSASALVGLAWQDGDGGVRENAFVGVPASGAFSEVNLGTVEVDRALLGTQRWVGTVRAYDPLVAGTLDVDYIYLIPCGEGYGEARASYSYQPGLLTGLDSFLGTAAGGGLNGRVAPQGGTWVTSGVAGDFVFADAPLVTDETISRSTVSEASGRIAQLGATNYAASEVGVDVRFTAPAFECAVSARNVDALNYSQLSFFYAQSVYGLTYRLVIAGSIVLTRTVIVSAQPGVWYRLRLVTYASGAVHGALTTQGGIVLGAIDTQHSALAVGGTHATGKLAFFDVNIAATACIRYYDNFYTAIPGAEPVSINSGRALELRHDGAKRLDASGTYWGNPTYRGSPVLIPVAGTRGRKTRIAVVARRNDLYSAPDDVITDSTTAELRYTPRYLIAPR